LEENKEGVSSIEKQMIVSKSLNSNELISKLKSENLFLRNENNLLLKKLRFSEQKNNELLKVKGFTISLDKLEGKEEEELLNKLNIEKRRNEENEKKNEEISIKFEENLRKIINLEVLLEKISKENEMLKQKELFFSEEIASKEREIEKKKLFIIDLDENIKKFELNLRMAHEKIENLELNEKKIAEENNYLRERILINERTIEDNADYYEKEVRKLKELIQIAEKELFEWKFKYDQNIEKIKKIEEDSEEAKTKIDFLNIEKGILTEENQELKY
jgi:hypothetical protein